MLVPDGWGIHHRWIDAHESVRQISDETVGRLRDVIGEPPDDLEAQAPIVTRPGRRLGLGRVEVECEDGSVRVVEEALGADFPLGYHWIRVEHGVPRRLIVSPGRCWLPDSGRAWGWTVQLYAARSHASWGIGDLGDLRAIREWSQELGAGFVLVNPLHAVAPTLPQETSPYLPSTRRFRNPIYLRVEDVPGAAAVDLSVWSTRGTAYNDSTLIDRDDVWALKREALEHVYAELGPSIDFVSWRNEQGGSLEEFAIWCVLAEESGPDWREWPSHLCDPAGVEVAAAASTNSERVTFHCWLQWLLEIQLKEASGDLIVISDLPIGVDGGGADAWAWQSTLATGMQIGAPPDWFNENGQDWGSPPLVPWRLRAAGYEPFIDSIRATMSSGSGLRIDHVMGLFRLWWVPQGCSPADGAYVRYPAEDLLDIVALESHRARSVVVGEDLGTVEPGVREALADHAILSYRLLWFEEDDPSTWPAASMAAITTHDLPTVAGLWTGGDLDEQTQYLTTPREQLELGREELLRRLTGRLHLGASAQSADVVEAAHRLLGRSPSMLLGASLEDAVVDERRPNMPGTLGRPNWRLPLAVVVDDLPKHPTASAVAAVMRTALRD
ncbi:MAG: 4-alpha-glucanotransferase [Propionibacteriales bacterium]|nr:4-alpha-glucanotransferase [Propionibacteriales bacterium]